MTPGARIAAAAEVLDALARERGPLDEVLRAWGRAHRFAGSKDRREIAERAYAALRARERIAWRMGADDGRTLAVGSLKEADGLEVSAIDALITGEGHAPTPLSPDERARLSEPPPPAPAHVRAGVPAFVAERLEAGFGADWEAEAAGLIGGRAPVDLRLNTLRGGREPALRLLAQEGVEPGAAPWSALGLRLPPAYATDVQRTRAFRDGWVEVQDEASQVACALAGARPGAVVVDYCAGGGGKTLALAAAMERTGELHALDVNARRLAALAPRLERAGARAEVRRIGPEGEGAEDLLGRADLVFVDAPCTGSGTWRRHPEACFRLRPEDVDRLAALQPRILANAARIVRPGGRLVYATCSVFGAENEAVAASFLAAHPRFRPFPVARAAEDAPGLTPAGRTRLAELAAGAHTVQLSPRRSGTDGFFAALFELTP